MMTPATLRAAFGMAANAKQGTDDNTSQLSQIAQERTFKVGEPRSAYFAIQDDDGTSEFMTKIKPVLDANGLKCGIAINPMRVGSTGKMTWAEIEQCHAEGFEILNHGWDHEDPATLTLAQLQANYELEKATFTAHGLDLYDYFVYPGVQPWSDADTKNKVMSVYKCSFANTDAPKNNIPFDSSAIGRTQIHLGITTQKEIDRCIRNKGFCSLFGHAYVADYTAQKLQDIIDYIDAREITYISTKDVIDNYINIFELGNCGSGSFYVDKNGNMGGDILGMSFSDMSKKVQTAIVYSSVAFANGDPDQYEENSITVEPISNTLAVKMGLPDAGTIVTVRYVNEDISPSEYYFTQTYTHFRDSVIYTRSYNAVKEILEPFLPVANVTVNHSTIVRAIKGSAIFDSVLNKPLYCSVTGYKNNATIARNTAFVKGEVIDKFAGFYVCTISGTTGASEPTWTAAAKVPDGTCEWRYMGAAMTWVDAAGSVVE